MNEPRYVDRATVDALHRLSLEEHGLESALAQPHHVFNYAGGDIADLTAAYAYHIAENQPFIDGNKRTAVLTALYFLELNGLNTSPLSNVELYDVMIGIAEKRIDKAGLAAIFRRALPPQG
jgi:death-on-curing protein